jgi:hypothetical protein
MNSISAIQHACFAGLSARRLRRLVSQQGFVKAEAELLTSEGL